MVHEKIATKKLCLPLVTSRRGSRREKFRGRERPDVSWKEKGYPIILKGGKAEILGNPRLV